MCAPASSSARKEASRPVRRSGLAMRPIVADPTLNSAVANLQQMCIVVVHMDLSDPQTFSRAYDEHERGVYAAAHRVLGDHAQAEDVVQDVFLRLWRRPQAFDASRGDLGTYLRMMARSRAIDLWREGQARGPRRRPPQVVVGGERRAVEELARRPRVGARRQPRGRARGAAAPAGAAARGARARLLGRADRRRRSPTASRSRSAPPRAASASASRDCGRNALLGARSAPRPTSLDIRTIVRPPSRQGTMPGRVGDRSPSRGRSAGGRRSQAHWSDAETTEGGLVLRPKLDWRAAVSGGALCFAYPAPRPCPPPRCPMTPRAPHHRHGLEGRRLDRRLNVRWAGAPSCAADPARGLDRRAADPPRRPLDDARPRSHRRPRRLRAARSSAPPAQRARARQRQPRPGAQPPDRPAQRVPLALRLVVRPRPVRRAPRLRRHARRRARSASPTSRCRAARRSRCATAAARARAA